MNAPGEKIITGKILGFAAIGTFSCACDVISPETTSAQLPPKTFFLMPLATPLSASIC